MLDSGQDLSRCPLLQLGIRVQNLDQAVVCMTQLCAWCAWPQAFQDQVLPTRTELRLVVQAAGTPVT